jgi:hypothetical protein
MITSCSKFGYCEKSLGPPERMSSGAFGPWLWATFEPSLRVKWRDGRAVRALALRSSDANSLAVARISAWHT